MTIQTTKQFSIIYGSGDAATNGLYYGELLRTEQVASWDELRKAGYRWPTDLLGMTQAQMKNAAWQAARFKA